MPTDIRIKSVLVVEDNEGDLQLIREIFGELSNVRWHFVTNLVQARDFLARRPPYQTARRPDLILLDLNLPIFPGHPLIAEARSNPELKDIRIVVFTSSDSERDRMLCSELGADDYIVKPISLEAWRTELARAIH